MAPPSIRTSTVSGEPVYQLLVSRPQGMLWRGIYATSYGLRLSTTSSGSWGPAIWLVKIPHTTGAAEAFDPAKEIDGAPVYEALMVEPAPYVPLGPVIDSAITEIDAAWAGTYVRVTYGDGAVSVYVPAFGGTLSGRRRDSLPAGNGPGSDHLPRRHRRHAERCCGLQPGVAAAKAPS